MRRQPRLLVTYDQLLEWLKYELTPSAGPGATQLAWHDLTYDGDIEKYIAELTKLFLQAPIEPAIAHKLAARPFGKELQCRISILDAMYPPDGMSIPLLKQQIRNFVIEKEASSHFPGWNAPPKLVISRVPKVRAVQIENAPPKHSPRKHYKPYSPSPHPLKNSQFSPKPQTNPVPPSSPYKHRTWEDKTSTPSKPSNSYPPPKYGDSPTPCYVCSSGQHPWIFCTKKQRGKCAVYRSMAHPTRICAQRYRPKPEARIHLAQVTPEIHADPLFFIEHMPDSDVEDRESGEHSEDEVDSDDEVEEAENALCRMSCVYLIEIDELSPLEWAS